MGDVSNNTYISVSIEPKEQKGLYSVTNEVKIFEKRNKSTDENIFFNGNIPNWEFFDILINSTLTKNEEE